MYTTFYRQSNRNELAELSSSTFIALGLLLVGAFLTGLIGEFLPMILESLAANNRNSTA
jgi:hypothetical protein